MKDYYKILGVEKGASEANLKKAYRKLAHQHHPDKPGGDEKKFKEINEAYQVLGNKEKKAHYDRYGRVFEGVPGGGAARGGGGFDSGGFGFDPSQVEWNINFEDIPDFGDIFDGLFGGGGRRSKERTRRSVNVKGKDVEIVQELTLEEAFHGIRRTLRFKTHVPCGVCAGKGYDEEAGMIQCGACGGKGETRRQNQTIFGSFSQVMLCGECMGEGKVPKKKCTVCKGKGRAQDVQEIELEIPPGVDDRQIIKVKGKGEAGEKGGEAGDAYIHVRVKPHAVFTREKGDLFMNKQINVTDALLGKKIETSDISGESLGLVVPPGYNLSEPLRVPGRGMPRFGHYSGPAGRGDLYITFNLILPTRLSAKAKNLLEELDGEL